MHGCGNDFIVLADMEDQYSWHELSDLARRCCRRRFGIGADGLIAVGRPADDQADFEMRYVNADGSRAEMCGNGIRCLGKFVAEELDWPQDTVRVSTGAGVLTVRLRREDGIVTAATVNMGVPKLRATEIPTTLRASAEQVVGVTLSVGSEQLSVTGVNMGNPHAVCFVDRITDELVEELGPALSAHPVFPQQANVEFVRQLGPSRLRMRVWERGVGETLACGTGACASVVAAVLNGTVNFDEEVAVVLNGGELRIGWTAIEAPVLMTGPAEAVYRGEFDSGG